MAMGAETLMNDSLLDDVISSLECGSDIALAAVSL